MDEKQQKEEKKKTIIFFALMLGLFIFIMIVAYFLFFYDFSEIKNLNPGQNEQEQLPDSGDKDNKQTKKEKDNSGGTTKIISPQDQENFSGKSEFTETDLRKLASSFAERFGSYSNQSQYDNIKDLKLFMSEDMRAWAENYLEEQRNKEYSGSYYGISTKSVTAKVQKFNPEAGEAKVLVQTQRIESEEGKEDKRTYRDIVLDFIKQDRSWKVDKAKWQ